MNVNIPNPCNKSWSGMTPADEGRHCSSCNTIVVNFTTMDEEEIKNYFLSATKKICGHFYAEQLNPQSTSKTIRLIQRWQQKAMKEIQYKWPRIIAGFVLGGTLTLMGCNSQEERVGKVYVTGDSIGVPVPEVVEGADVFADSAAKR